jgi:hypothetical protein
MKIVLEILCRCEYPKIVMSRRFRFGSALGILLVLTSAPALNCMSLLYRMDMREMACCKDMGGDCDMARQDESCCQTSSNPYATNATIASKVVHVPAPTLPIALAFLPDSILVANRTTPAEADDGSPPPSPPGSIPVLRI